MNKNTKKAVTICLMQEKLNPKPIIQEIPTTWQSIPIIIKYQPHYSQAVLKIMGYQLAHVQIKAEEPLPITETGYRSIFLPNQIVQQMGGVVSYVNAVLDEASQSKKWKNITKTSASFAYFKTGKRKKLTS